MIPLFRMENGRYPALGFLWRYLRVAVQTVLTSNRHVMEPLPELTVCDECYDAVVWPLVEDDQNTSEIPHKFIRGRQTVPLASCQLYSNRMQDAFRKACRRNDLSYLETKLREKLVTESDVSTSQPGSSQGGQNDVEVRRLRAS